MKITVRDLSGKFSKQDGRKPLLYSITHEGRTFTQLLQISKKNFKKLTKDSFIETAPETFRKTSKLAEQIKSDFYGGTVITTTRPKSFKEPKIEKEIERKIFKIKDEPDEIFQDIYQKANGGKSYRYEHIMYNDISQNDLLVRSYKLLMKYLEKHKENIYAYWFSFRYFYEQDGRKIVLNRYTQVMKANFSRKVHYETVKKYVDQLIDEQERYEVKRRRFFLSIIIKVR